MHCQDTVALFPGPLKMKVPVEQPTVIVTVSPLGYTVSLAGVKVTPCISLLAIQFAPP